MHDLPINRAERSRTDILQAAYQLFLAHGYHGTSMRQISQSAGVALGSIYNHFPSKEQLFLEVFMQEHPFFQVLPVLLSVQGDTVESFVRNAAQTMVGHVNQRMDYLNLLFIELVEFKGQHIPQVVQLIFPQVMEIAERLVEHKTILRSIPLPIMIRAFIGLFFSYLMTDIIFSSQLPAELQEKALNYFIDIYLYGILESAEET